MSVNEMLVFAGLYVLMLGVLVAVFWVYNRIISFLCVLADDLSVNHSCLRQLNSLFESHLEYINGEFDCIKEGTTEYRDSNLDGMAETNAKLFRMLYSMKHRMRKIEKRDRYRNRKR